MPPILLAGYRHIRKGISGRDRRLAQRPVTELFPGIEQVSVCFPFSQLPRERGMLPLGEILTLAAICECVRPRRIFEIGTYKGASTLLMAIHTPDDAEIFTLDLPPDSAIQNTRSTLATSPGLHLSSVSGIV